MIEWTTAELPLNKNDAMYVVWYDGDYMFAFFDGDCWDLPDCGFVELKDITHWALLPNIIEVKK